MSMLSNSEHEILAVLWSQGRGLTAVEINELAQHNSWKNTSIHPLLSNLLDKELIRVDGVKLVGRHYSRIFSAAISAEEYAVLHVNTQILYTPNKQKSLTTILASLINMDDINLDTISNIEEILRKKREEL